MVVIVDHIVVISDARHTETRWVQYILHRKNRKTASCFSGFFNQLYFQQFETKVKCNYVENKRTLTF